jgi:hypothetical protein
VKAGMLVNIQQPQALGVETHDDRNWMSNIDHID